MSKLQRHPIIISIKGNKHGNLLFIVFQSHYVPQTIIHMNNPYFFASAPECWHIVSTYVHPQKDTWKHGKSSNLSNNCVSFMTCSSLFISDLVSLAVFLQLKKFSSNSLVLICPYCSPAFEPPCSVSTKLH